MFENFKEIQIEGGYFEPSVKELTEAFHETVDDYLSYYEDEGIEYHLRTKW